MRQAVCLVVSLVVAYAVGREPDEKHKAEIAKDVKLGKEYAAEIEKLLELSEDIVLLERVHRVGVRFAEIARLHHIPATWGDKRHSVFEYTFKVVADADVNAFSVPGGFIYVNSGLLDFVESDDELAAVLAHEVAHAANRHLITLMRERSKVDVWTLPLVLAALLGGAKEAGPLLLTRDLLTTALTNSWGQEAEKDADRTGFFYLTKSQYHPVAILTFMERLAFKERNSPRVDWGIHRTHPPSRIRARAIEKMLRQAELPIARSKVTTSFRVTSDVQKDRVIVLFGRQQLFALRGEDAEARAEKLVPKLNSFFDSAPELFHVSAVGNRLVWKGRTLVEFEASDVGPGQTPGTAALEALAATKRALYSLGFRTGG